MHAELASKNVVVVTVSMEVSGPEASRHYIETAKPEHPSLLDPTYQMASLFGVINIPNIIWINEEGVIVRPAEPGWPAERPPLPKGLFAAMPKMGRSPRAPKRDSPPPDQLTQLSSGQNRNTYVDAIRDWADKGAASEYVLSPEDVIARSQPRPLDKSEGAAHFEMANHLWQAGQRDAAIVHFNECHRLQPENWTYKRQAWSLLGYERVGGEYGRWVQAPLEGEEADWPFTSDFRSDLEMLEAGEYYPATL